MTRWIVILAALLGCLGVGIGAFAAHGLEKYLLDLELDPQEIADRSRQCEVAVRYQMYHVLALLLLGTNFQSRRSTACAAVLFLLGIGLFCGGLYSMVFFGQMGHWAIVPAGGLCFMLGWLSLLAVTLPARAPHDREE